MKISVSLLLLALGLAFGAGYIALLVRQNEGHRFNFSVSEVNTLKRQFRDKGAVRGELNTTNLFAPQAGFELIDPRLVLSPSHGRRFAEVASVFRADKLCRPDLITNSDFEKMKKWIAYRCGQLQELPKTFFEQSPFMSPIGMSFANLALLSGRAEFESNDWIVRNIQAFHALELNSPLVIAGLKSGREVLGSLDPETLLAMTSGQSWIGSENYILVRRTSELNADIQHTLPTVDYFVYDRSDWDLFLIAYGLETKRGQTAGCAYREDGLCWTKSASPERKIQWTMGLLFFLAAAIIIFCVVQIIRTIRNQRFEEERKRFALQALTHELRTPLASLVVSSEQVLNQFDSLPSFAKDPFLRIADDIQRLTRVAESSRNYLKAANSNGLVSFEFTELPSINAFVTSTLERYSDLITINLLTPDESFILDRYWVGVCLQNIVQNACQHGGQPVVVNVKTADSTLVLSVSDSGEIQEKDKNNFLKPFFKNSRSSGLGLGLTIVQTVMVAMNSKLKISAKPTSVELWIARSR